MTVLAGAVCPHPPLLVPEVASGAAVELDELRTACDAAVAAGLAAGPERVIVVGGGGGTQRWPNESPGALAGFGIAGFGPPGDLPLSLTIGRWLLWRAGWTGPVELQSVGPQTSAAACAELGVALGAGTPAFLLAMGDGSARRSLAAPGHLDTRAEDFDADVAKALAGADVEALLAVDPVLAGALLATGRPAWQVLAGAVGVTPAQWRGELGYDAAPYGVGYFVASLAPGD
ncbi:MAG: class III extradiol dioxygenase subunit B-like domain-containing protein [Sporichthyaceae bacterium]